MDIDKNNADKTIFRVFDRLIKSNHKREKSCAALVDFLKGSDEKVGSATAALYAAKRLVRGLGSHEAERQNIFFAALCTALSSDAVSVDNVVSALTNIVDNIGSSKSEQATVHVTTVLTYGAVLKAGKLNLLSSELQASVLSRLVTSCNSKSYIKTAASAFLIEFIKDIPRQTMKSVLLPAVKQQLDESGVDTHVENDFLAVCSVSYFKYPKLMQKVVDSHFGGRNELFEDICARCTYFPNHVQEEILRLLCSELALSGNQLLKLWKSLLEKEHKFNPKWNAYILLFAKTVMDTVPSPELVAQSLQHKLIDVILKSLQAHDKQSKADICYIRAQQVVEKLVARVIDKDHESNLSLNVLKTILAHPAGLQFDQKTRTRAVQSMITNLRAEDVKKLADEFVAMISGGPKKDGKMAKTPREIELILSLLVKLLSHPDMKKDINLLLKYVKFIFNIAFVKAATVSADLRAKANDLFYKSIALHQMKVDDAVVILNDLILYAEEKMSELVVQLNESDTTQWKNMLATNKKLGAQSSDKKFCAVRLLLLHMGLLMFKDQALACSTIEELLQCYERIKEGKKKKQKDSDQEPHWVEVTVDLLLAMLSRENKLLRHVVSSVFPSITPHLTATALQQIVDALDPAARNDVLKHVESDDSDEDGEEEESDEGEEDGEEDDSPVEGEEETVNDKLRMAVRNALGYSAALTDDESVDMDDMNEDEEKRLNESLASAFRLFRPGRSSKKKQSKDDEALTHFRVRVLDLVEIIVTTTPPLASCLELLSPLFTLLEFAIKDPHQKPLQNRLEAVLKKLGGVKKFKDELHVTYLDLVTCCKELFERETSGLVCVEMAPALTECCGLLVRAAQLLPRDSDGETLENVFGHLLNRFFKANDRKVPFSLFQSVLRMLWDGNWHLSERIMSLLLDPDLKLFKKFKLVELLEIFYKNDRLQSTATDDCKKAACSFESKFVKKFAKALAEYDTKKNTKLLPTFYGRLQPYVQLAMQSKNRYRENCSPAPSWALVVSHLIQRIHLLPQQKTRNKLLHLAQQCNIPIPDKMDEVKTKGKKRSHEESADEEEEIVEVKEKKKKKKKDVEEVSNLVTEKPGKKRKSGVDVRKLRQESRDLREAASSHGLAQVTFCGMDIDALEEDQADTITTVKKSKKSTVESTEKKKKKKSK